jgi:hypothetical protein
MSKFEFRPAKRERVSLLVGLSGGTGSGKTYSAMRLAKGLAGGNKFCVIDTEAGRAQHYADLFAFDHGDLQPPFRPSAYADAIKAADDAKYPVIVVDSASHEWAGEGGILDWHEDELDRMAGTDWKKREAVKMAAWIQPKMGHKQMVQRLLQIRAHLILCFRAEPKVEMRRGTDGKMEIVEKQSLTGLHGWIPICEKNLPYELTASFLLMPDKPGVPQAIKLQEQHREFFPANAPITEAAGERLAAWARGGSVAAAAAFAKDPDRLVEDVIDWPARIADAKTKTELQIVGKELSKAKGTMLPAVLDTIRAIYEERLKKFTTKTTKAADVVTAEDIKWSS